MLSVSDLTVWYVKDKNILQEVNFSLDNHIVIGLLGINGAGKTTLINFLSGVHKHYSVKSLSYNNAVISIKDVSFKADRYTVFTEEQAFSYWSFEEYTRFVHSIYSKSVDKATTDELVAGFGFEQYRNYKIKDLSTGNRKKVFLITGLSLRLPLLILDEPLDGLDFQSSEYLYQAINNYKAYGAVFMSSHIAESFEKTCDKILLLDNSRIIEKTLPAGADIRAELAGWLHD